MNEFLIDSCGILIKYKGKGGDVVIPEGVQFIARYDVFDPKLKITSLSLPKSFLGHRREFTYHSYAYTYKWSIKEQRVLDKSEFNFHRLPPDKGTEIYAYLLQPKLPYLVEYKVHPDNQVYAVCNGHLYTKDMSVLLSVPAKNKQSIVFKDGGCESTNEVRELLKRRVVRVDYTGDHLDTKCLYKAESLSMRMVEFNAPKLKTCSGFGGVWFFDERRNTAIIAPKLDLEDVCQWFIEYAALGYCYAADEYIDSTASKLRKVLVDKEIFFYNLALKKKLEPVMSYYEKSWQDWQVKDLQIQNATDARRYLFDVILYGSVEDVKKTLKLEYDFSGINEYHHREASYNGAQMLAIAGRYGGFDKFKALLDCEKFCNATITDEYYKTTIEDFIRDGKFEWMTGLLFFRQEPPYFNDQIPISRNNEIRDLSPVSQEERIQCLKLLFERKLLDDKNLDFACFYALMTGEFKIATFLREQGAKFDRLADYKNLEHIQEHRLKIFNYAVKKQQEGLKMLAQYAYEDGCPLYIPKHMLFDLFAKHTELLYELIEYLYVTNPAMADLLNHCIENNLTEPLGVFINKGKIKTKAALQKYIDKAMSLEAHEITAILLEYKNSKYISNRKVKRSSLSL